MSSIEALHRLVIHGLRAMPVRGACLFFHSVCWMSETPRACQGGFGRVTDPPRIEPLNKVTRAVGYLRTKCKKFGPATNASQLSKRSSRKTGKACGRLRAKHGVIVSFLHFSTAILVA
jgi:hypothetical protein